MSDAFLQSSEHTSFGSYIINLKGESEFYVEGYIATYDKDKVNDVITRKGMESIYDTVTEVKADLEHEAFVPDDKGYGVFGSRSGLIPVGKVEEKRLDNIGVWVKAKLNPHLKGFEALWKSVKDGFVDSFSIAFSEPQSGDFMIRDDGARLLNHVNLLNFALTGNPVNPNAAITNVIAKSMNFKEDKMSKEEEEVKTIEPEVKAEEPVVEVPVEETPSAELKAINDRLEAIEDRLATAPVEKKSEPKVDYKAVLEKLEKIEKTLAAPVLKGEINNEIKKEKEVMDFTRLL